MVRKFFAGNLGNQARQCITHRSILLLCDHFQKLTLNTFANLNTMFRPHLGAFGKFLSKFDSCKLSNSKVRGRRNNLEERRYSFTILQVPGLKSLSRLYVSVSQRRSITFVRQRTALSTAVSGTFACCSNPCNSCT